MAASKKIPGEKRWKEFLNFITDISNCIERKLESSDKDEDPNTKIGLTVNVRISFFHSELPLTV